MLIVNDVLERCYSGLEKYNYDFVIVSSLLHEVESAEMLLTSVFALCNNDTIVHINVPNAKSFHRLLALESGLIDDVYQLSERNVQLQQHRVYDMDMLIDFIREVSQKMGVNISIIEKGSFFVKPFTHSQMAMLLQHNIVNEQILGGLYNMIKYMPELGSEIYVNLKIKRK